MSAFRRILFLGRFRNRQPLSDLLETTLALKEKGIAVAWSEAVAAAAAEDKLDTAQLAEVEVVAVEETIPLSALPDLAVVLGGDGAFVRAVNRFAPLGVRLVGINLGSLGFLTDISRDNMQPAIMELVDGRYDLEDRSLLSVATIRKTGKAGKTTNEVETHEHGHFAVNDVVITYGEPSVLATMRVFVGDSFAFDLRADGLIAATPTGSTAYALSAGGPIIHPQLAAMLLVPLSPHSLTHRPLVVPADSRIRVEVIRPKTKPMVVHMDGKSQRVFQPDDGLEIFQPKRVFTICHPERYDYYQTLRRKLSWGE